MRYFTYFSLNLLDSFENVSVQLISFRALGHWWKIGISIRVAVVGLHVLLASMHCIKIIVILLKAINYLLQNYLYFDFKFVWM